MRSPMRSRRRYSSSEWKAARRRVLREDRAHALVVLDQKVAGGRAHEDLDAGSARQALELGDVGRVLARAADPEGEVAMHAAVARATLSASAASLVVSGLVFGISKTEVTPPSTAAREPRFEVFLVRRGPARGNAPGCR